MITGYHRPATLTDALILLGRSSPTTVPLGGGTQLNRSTPDEADQAVEVVDLQTLIKQPELGLGQIVSNGNTVEIGAGVTLHRLIDEPTFPKAIQKTLDQILRNELTFNLRQVATVGGTIVSSIARSGLTAALLALDATLELTSLQDGPSSESLGDFLALRRVVRPGRLILKVKVPVNGLLAYQAVSRTPADFPIISAAVTKWPSGRTRVVLGGFGQIPLLAMDGPDSAGAGIASREAFRDAQDEWASTDYRSEMAEILVNRCLSSILEEVNE